MAAVFPCFVILQESDAAHMMITDMGLMSAGSLQGTELHQVENIKGLHLAAVSLL